jgi:hypothetical protein
MVATSLMPGSSQAPLPWRERGYGQLLLLGDDNAVESDIEEFSIGHGRGRGLRVLGSSLLGHLAHHLFVPEQFAVVGVETRAAKRLHTKNRDTELVSNWPRASHGGRAD